MRHSKLDDLEPFTTLDGSTIREIAGRAGGGSAPAEHQSLAEATVPAGGQTVAHFHRTIEELYLFTAGSGRMRLGEQEREIAAGDCVVIAPGEVHKLWSSAGGPLVLLCCCSPPYSHEDTVLCEPA